MTTTADRLNQLLAQVDSPSLTPEQSEKFTAYLTLLQRWNARTNLTAIRDEEGILSRHFVESILCARALPVEIVSLLDFGSGAGFPGLPIAIIRNEISVTLAESQNKKATFLREAARVLNLPTKVHSARAEQLTQTYNGITLRAVDNMEQAIPAAIKLLSPNGWLALMTTQEEIPSIQTQTKETPILWQPEIPLPKNTNRILLLGKNSNSQLSNPTH
ncbi:16S rRNA (guanine(527)-N(7))-methyltransferase RsmG [Acidicapsa ligni]|uniref:16S rRNA (guanine(527)-N(7))-methyltransferase RsmG n=1 Tax=Acidicapsa ligni TaxID=542300 RepID=UPI0021E056AE|nr:16S rRNA (guanine(527)-N(7))-methyltransferase RsmG [Acidicapsa ligni]